MEGRSRPLPEHLSDPSVIARHRDELMRRVGGEPVDPAEPTLLGDKLRLIRCIGKGGMGTVWVAEHVGLGIRVAVKRPQHELVHDERLRRRFLREARSAAAVKHPSVAAILDVAADGADSPYIVMELVDGEPLGEVLRRDAPLPWSRASALLVQLARALECAHAQGVVHRDLKPSNVLVRCAGTVHEAVKIIDFGLATRCQLDSESRELTHTGDVFGSPAYMSPEQLRSANVDGRADIYSLTCIGFEMLTGRKPFLGPTTADFVVQHLTHVPPNPAPLRADAAQVPAIRAVILRGLRKEPAERHPTMGAFADEIEAINALQSSPLARARSRAVAIATSCALAGAGWAWWAQHTRGRAEADARPFTVELPRPIAGSTPPWPVRWLGTELGIAEPRRDPNRPDRTGADAVASEIVLWADDPRQSQPYGIMMPRADAFALAQRAVHAGLTLGHVADPAVERTGRSGDPATGRVFWRAPREFPLRAIGRVRIGPGCTGVPIGPVHVLTSADCVWAQGGYVRKDPRWQPGDDRYDEQRALEFIRVYVPQQWPQNDRSGLFDWAIAITQRRIGDEYFGVTALGDDLLRAALYHKGYPVEHDRVCDARSPAAWQLGANRPWGNPEPLTVTPQALRAPSPVSGWQRVLATTAVTSTGHGGGPYYYYDSSNRPVVVAIQRSACTDEDGGSPEFCGYTGPWRCGAPAKFSSQAIRLEPNALYGHIVPVLTWWGVGADGRAVCLLDGGC
jgi:serine/threonine protein kinase